MSDATDKKISVSQCMAELLCSELSFWDEDSKDNYLYLLIQDSWNKLSSEARGRIIDNLREYLTDCVGSDSIED